jgi:hypothetical protein
VDDQRQRAAGLEQVVHRFGDVGLVGPVEGLAEGDEAVRTGRSAGEILGSSLDPADVRKAQLVRGASAFGEHRRVGIEAYDVLEEMCEPDREDAGTTPAVEKPPTALEAELPGQNGLELR